jgi:hypothetical protein
MTTLDPLLTAGGLTFVEQVINGAVTTRVYKSPAGSNFFGSDWFFSVSRATDTATTVTFRVFEQYNSSTHLCFNYAPSTNSLTPTSVFAVNDATGKAPDSASLGSNSVTISAAGFNWLTSVTANRVAIATRVSTTDYSVYLGLYRDMLPLAASPFPLVLTSLHSTTGGFATREPGTTTSVNGNFRTALTYTWTPTNTGASVYTGASMLSRVPIDADKTPAGVNFRGHLTEDVWRGAPSGANGDTLSATIDGVAKTLVQFRNGAGGATMFVDSGV